ncbi:MAG: cysteine peptidase family C39 domain-containing protein, partial [Candidatus Omnitrophota bacterium]
MRTKKPLFQVISVAVALIFFITQTGWPQDQQYIPFNENQDQSQYLAPEQLQRFSDIKNTLIEQHNVSTGTPLQTEEEIIAFLYGLINPLDFTVLKQLENEYISSVAEKEAAWQDFVNQRALLEDYFNQLDYLTSSLNSINLQIGSVEQKLNDVEQDKEETQTSIQELENRVASKSSSVQSKLSEATALESDINDLETVLSQLNDEKAVRKNDLDAAEALLDEKTFQKEAMEAELDVIQSGLDTKLEEIEATEDPVEKAQKESEYAALQILYNDKLAAYDSFMPEYTAAQTAYQIALSAYENKLSAIDAAEAEITQCETDLLSDYETIKLLELEIDTLDEEIAAETSRYDYLDSMMSSLEESLDRLNFKKADIETLLGLAFTSVEQALEESGTNEKLQDFKAAVENERVTKSLYEEALESMSGLISSLKDQDKKLQSALLAIILEPSLTIQQEDQVGIFHETGGQTVVLTEDQINDILLAISDGAILADGRTVLDEINRTETVRRSLRESYSKVFGKEPTEKMLNAFVDIISRAKMPAIRLFEILKRISDKNLKATEDQKLDAEDSAIDPGDVEQGSQGNLLLNIVMRLQDKSFVSESIKGAMSYLTTLPLPLVSCGIIALGGLFEQIGKSVSGSTLAEEAILSDIFSGAINKDTTGELKLSLFALKQAAEANGVTLHGQNISEGALENTNSPFIAHVNGNHYVLVKKIEDGQVTYFDPAPGSDQVASLQDFGQFFTGNALLLSAVEGGAALSESEMKNIFGAGLFSSIRSAVSRAVSKVSSAAKSVAKSVSKAVSTAAKTVSKTVSSAAKTVSKAVSSAVKTVSKTVSKAVSSAKNTVSRAVSSVSNSVKNTAAKVVNAVSEAASKAKDALANAAEKAKDKVTTVKDAVVNYVSEKVEQAKTVVSEKAEQAKTFIFNKIDQANAYVANKVEAANIFISDKAEAAREFISDKAESAKETVLNKFEEFKDYASNKLDEMKNSASETFSGIGNVFNRYVELVSSPGLGLLPGVSAAPDTIEPDLAVCTLDGSFPLSDLNLDDFYVESQADNIDIEIDPGDLQAEGIIPDMNTLNCDTHSTYVPEACDHLRSDSELSPLAKEAISGSVGMTATMTPVCTGFLAAGGWPGAICFGGSAIFGAIAYPAYNALARWLVPDEQKILGSAGTGFVPGVGDGQDMQAALFGEDPITGEKDLPLWQRAISFVAALPVVGIFINGGIVRGASKADEVVDAVKALSKADEAADAAKAAAKAEDAADAAKAAAKAEDAADAAKAADKAEDAADTAKAADKADDASDASKAGSKSENIKKTSKAYDALSESDKAVVDSIKDSGKARTNIPTIKTKVAGQETNVIIKARESLSVVDRPHIHIDMQKGSDVLRIPFENMDELEQGLTGAGLKKLMKDDHIRNGAL